MRSFICWLGGKSLLAGRIAAMIPSHQVYIEPFMGAAWTFFKKPQSPVEALNDLNQNLVNLFRVVKDRFEDFYGRRIFLLACEREYKDFTARLNHNGPWKDDVERALAFWYCLKQAFAGQIGRGWCFSRTRPPKSLEMEDLRAIHERLKRIYISDQDFEACIKRWDGPRSFFYLDPPYMVTTRPEGRDYYQCTMTVEDHARLRAALGRIQGKFLLSYDDDPWVREAYQDFRITEIETRYTVNNRPGQPRHRAVELLIKQLRARAAGG
ncbi:MAG: DNA adenine methylase [Thermodesulfobacteriota bacterium]